MPAGVLLALPPAVLSEAPGLVFPLRRSTNPFPRGGAEGTGAGTLSILATDAAALGGSARPGRLLRSSLLRTPAE